MLSNKSQILKLYEKYQYLANFYANKVFNYERYGFTKDDVVQEMNIKLYKSIIGFGRQWKEYRTTGKRKPVPLEYWLRSSLMKKVLDYAKLFSYERVENSDKVSIGESSFDIGYHNTATLVMDMDNLVCEINGVNILFGLEGDRRKCYAMYAYGHTNRELIKMFPDVDVNRLIEQHNNYLRTKKRDELLNYSQTKFEVFQYEEA